MAFSMPISSTFYLKMQEQTNVYFGMSDTRYKNCCKHSSVIEKARLCGKFWNIHNVM